MSHRGELIPEVLDRWHGVYSSDASSYSSIILLEDLDTAFENGINRDSTSGCVLMKLTNAATEVNGGSTLIPGGLRTSLDWAKEGRCVLVTNTPLVFVSF